MATTKKSTSISAKTTRDSKTSRASKTTSRSAKSTTSSAAHISDRESMRKLRTAHIVAAALLVLQAAALLILSDKSRGLRGINVSYLAEDRLQSSFTNSTVYVQAVHRLFDTNVLYMVMAALILAAISHILRVTVMRKKYEAELGEQKSTLRWLEFAVSGGLLLVTIALLNGMHDLMSLTMLFSLGVISALLGYVFEAMLGVMRVAHWVMVALVVAAALLPWIIIGSLVKDALMFGSGLPKYLYVLDAAAFLFYLCTEYILYLSRRCRGRFSNYLWTEFSLLVVGFTAASSIIWLIFAGTLS